MVVKMRYKNVREGIFIERPNRFVAICSVDGKKYRAHVKNTGRCRELLIPGTKVWLEDHKGRMGGRKLRFSLISVLKGDRVINMDSQAPNQAVEEALASGRIKLPGLGRLTEIRREKTFGDSRFDFYLEDADGHRAFAEVKGVTLEKNDAAYFPDAPTERGLRHIKGLEAAENAGYAAYILFIVQMKGIVEFRPNYRTHPEFGRELERAAGENVSVLAFECSIKPDAMEVGGPVPVRLRRL